MDFNKDANENTTKDVNKNKDVNMETNEDAHQAATFVVAGTGTPGDCAIDQTESTTDLPHMSVSRKRPVLTTSPRRLGVLHCCSASFFYVRRTGKCE